MDGAMRLKILHIICFLLLLGSGDFQVRGLTVTGKAVPTEALRGENVTIPCLLSGVPIPLNMQILSVVWTFRLENGTEIEIYRFRGSHHQSLRPGSHMNDRDLQEGNASLSITDLQIRDEGGYRCFVIVSPDAGSATSTLHVSVKPQATLSHDKSIKLGITGNVFCDVSNFYPNDVKIRWVKYRKTTDTNLTSDKDFVVTIPIRNSDGTYNISSMLTVEPYYGDKPGDVFSCIVSHRSLKEEIAVHLTVTEWTPLVDLIMTFLALNFIPFLTFLLEYSVLKGWRPWTTLFFLVFVIFLVLLCCSLLYFLLDYGELQQEIYILIGIFIFSYSFFIPCGIFPWRYFRKGEPSVSNISGDPCIPHMKRTTLTCQITNFRLKEIQINIYLKRRNDIKKHIIASWDSTDQILSNNLSSDLSMDEGQRDNNSGIMLIPLEEDAEVFPVEMKAEITKPCILMDKCLCSITITPNADTDDGAVLAVAVEHASLMCPTLVYTTLNVYKGDAPSLWRRWKM